MLQIDRQTGQRSDSIGRTVLQTVAQKCGKEVITKIDLAGKKRSLEVVLIEEGLVKQVSFTFTE